MIRSALLLLIMMPVAVAADTPAGPAAPSYADTLYLKLLADNTRDADKAFDTYAKAVAAANARILKGLEAAKADLNDPKKGKLTITERVKAIDEIDARIKDVNNGAVGDAVVACHGNNDPLADLADAKDAIVEKWNFTGGWVGGITFDKTTVAADNGHTGTYATAKNTVTVTWDTGTLWVFTYDAGKMTCTERNTSGTKAPDKH